MELPVQFGRYQVAECLGSGQMGTVYRAVDPAIERPVAVKVLRDRPELAAGDREDWRARFEREVHVTGRLSHPHIVAVLDVGLEGDDAFIVMEYVDGSDLDDLLAQRGTLPVDRALQICAEVATALDHAHRHGVVHRDVKPANILLTGDGTAKVADFGVAQVAEARLTRTGLTCGTPAFMSPEQATAHDIGPASDQFSLAAVAYLMLVGEIPFSGSSASAVLYRLVNESPVPAASINPVVSTELSAALDRALAKSPALRYESCSAMVAALRAAHRGALGETGVGAGGGGAFHSVAPDNVASPRAATAPPPATAAASAGHRATTVMTPATPAHAGAGLRELLRELAGVPGARAGLIAAPLLLLALLLVWALGVTAKGAPTAAGSDPAGAAGIPAAGAEGGAGDPARRGTDADGDANAPVEASAPRALPTGLAERARNAGAVLGELLGAADGIPRRVLADARCVAVIPGVIRVGFGLGGYHGKGLVSCRIAGGWSSPSFVAFSGASFGLQVGAQSSDLVLLFAAREALEQLSGDELTLGVAGASVSAGPPSGARGADADAAGDIAIYSYSRSTGLFAGLSLEGATLRPDQGAIRNAYGRGAGQGALLRGLRDALAPELADFVGALVSATG